MDHKNNLCYQGTNYATLKRETKKCFYCGISFKPSASSCKECDKCRKFIQDLHEGMLREDQFFPGFILQVRYKIVKQKHNDLCSSPKDVETEKYKETFTFRVPRILTKNDFNENDTMDLANTKVKYFEKHPIPHGNGYCGLSTTYTITRIKLKKSKIPLKNFLH